MFTVARLAVLVWCVTACGDGRDPCAEVVAEIDAAIASTGTVVVDASEQTVADCLDD